MNTPNKIMGIKLYTYFFLMWTSITSIIFGLIMRLAFEYKEGRLTWKVSFIHIIFSVCVCYFFYLLRRDLKWAISLDLMLAIVSFFASYMVSLMDKFGKIGIRSYFLRFISRYAAEAELKNPEDDTNNK